MTADTPPAKPLRTWRPIVLWSAGILLALGLVWFIAAVVVPIFQIRRTVLDYFAGGRDAEAAVERLGGPERAAARLRAYLYLPDAIAPCKSSAASILVWETMSREETVAALRDPSELVRRTAASVLAKTATPADKEFIPQLLEALADPDPTVRSRAASALGRIGPVAVEALPELIKALAEPGEFAISSAAHALGDIGLEVRVTVPALIKALQDPSPRVRSGAAHALGAIGPAAAGARPALVTASQDADEDVAREAKFALDCMHAPPEYDPVPGKEGEPKPKSDIDRALESDDPEVRAAAAEALRSLHRGRTPAAAVLRKIRGEEPAK